MHPMLVFAARYGPTLAPWLLAHSGELGDAAARLTRPVMAAITDPTASIDRIGSALVAQQNGQTEVIGLLHRQADATREVAAAVDGVRDAQEAIAGSANLLTSLSMVGLGMSVLSHGVLSIQLVALTRRLDRLASDVRQIRTMLQAQHRGELTAGLTALQNGIDVLASDPPQATRFFDNAIGKLTGSSANYAEQLRGEAGSGNHDYLWLLSRHLTVSALSEAACQLQLGHPTLAVRSLETALVRLREHAQAVFARTIETDPIRFLIPAMAPHGVTLEAMAELYRQAGHAGAARADHPLSAAERFEALRGRLYAVRDPRFRTASVVRRLSSEWSEATAAIEEVNRVKGLALAIGTYHSPTRSYTELVNQILREVDVRRAADGGCFAVFPAAAGG